MRQLRSAKGMRGTLLSAGDGVLIFRQYDKDHKFTDYYIRNMDMNITIEDDDAFVKIDDDLEEYYIDYSNRTLGKKG